MSIDAKLAAKQVTETFSPTVQKRIALRCKINDVAKQIQDTALSFITTIGQKDLNTPEEKTLLRFSQVHLKEAHQCLEQTIASQKRLSEIQQMQQFFLLSIKHIQEAKD